MVTEREFLDFAAGLMGIPADGVTLETAYQSVPQWDSVMHLRLVMELEEAYGVSIPLEAIGKLRTLRDFWGYVNR